MKDLETFVDGLFCFTFYPWKIFGRFYFEEVFDEFSKNIFQINFLWFRKENSDF